MYVHMCACTSTYTYVCECMFPSTFVKKGRKPTNGLPLSSHIEKGSHPQEAYLRVEGSQVNKRTIFDFAYREKASIRKKPTFV